MNWIQKKKRYYTKFLPNLSFILKAIDKLSISNEINKKKGVQPEKKK